MTIPQSTIPISHWLFGLQYVFFVPFFFFAINTRTAFGFFMKATTNPSLPHFEPFIEMFASLVCGLAGLVDTAIHS